MRNQWKEVFIALITVASSIAIIIISDIWITRLFYYKPCLLEYLFPAPLFSIVFGGIPWLVVGYISGEF